MKRITGDPYVAVRSEDKRERSAFLDAGVQLKFEFSSEILGRLPSNIKYIGMITYQYDMATDYQSHEIYKLNFCF
jgi:hypothetical protein